MPCDDKASNTKLSARITLKEPPDGATVATAARVILAENPRTTATSVAVALGVSRRTVERCVRLTFDLSFRALRDQVLLERLSQFRRQFPDASVKQAAYEVGYAQPRSLSRHIRKLTGMPTTQL